LKLGQGLPEITNFIIEEGMLKGRATV